MSLSLNLFARGSSVQCGISDPATPVVQHSHLADARLRSRRDICCCSSLARSSSRSWLLRSSSSSTIVLSTLCCMGSSIDQQSGV